jgi:hypothetical protein
MATIVEDILNKKLASLITDIDELMIEINWLKMHPQSICRDKVVIDGITKCRDCGREMKPGGHHG